MKNVNKRLQQVSRLLASKRESMFCFMEKYLFSQIKVQRTETIKNLDNFRNMIDFCLRTKQAPGKKQIEKAKRDLCPKLREIQRHVKYGNMEKLRELVYSCPGVGQKIGSLILEVIIHYGEANPELERELFVPIDRHVRRIFTDCLDVEDVPEGVSPDSPKYLKFQERLATNTAKGLPRIYFDYLWFIGKAFCAKIDATKNGYSRGYRLCSLCWIKKYCILSDKWITP